MDSSKEHISETVKKLLISRNSPAGDRSSIIFDQLSVEGSGRGAQSAPTIWKTIKSWISIQSLISYTRPQPSRTLLHGFTGTLHSGEMLLVIGKPGSGCTTFLKTLANMREEFKNTTGLLTYGGHQASEWPHGQVRLSFCEEEDNHLPTLTVGETLRFAVRATWDANKSPVEIDDAVATLAKCFGLSHVLKTKVGSAAIRGVSGGERRRVSLAETMVTCANVICFDNPTNGLDSSTALEFMQMMREFTTQHGCSTAMSVYQGSDTMVPLFDKVVVIHSGRQIFYGGSLEAKTYFESLGFFCPERMTITDFLNSMTSGPELRHVRDGWGHRVPIAAVEFENAFRQSQYYKACVNAVTTETQNIQPIGLKNPVYSLPLYRQVLECAFRQSRVIITDYNTWMIGALCIIIQSLVLGTLFRNQPRSTRSFFSLASSLFYSVLVPALQALSEFGDTFAQRPLIMRQKQYRFYRPISYALGLFLTDAIWKIIAITYNIPQYFLTGFQTSPDKFFIWFFIVYVEHMALSMIVRSVAVFSPNINRAILPVGVMFNIIVLYTGLYVPGPQMQGWLFWLKFCSPLYYAFESVMTNEFGNLSYICDTADIAPNGIGYSSLVNKVCTVKGSHPGEEFVLGASYLEQQYGFQTRNLWRNVGINAALLIFFAICTGIGMELYKLPAGRLATVFYTVERKEFISERAPVSSDSEKGSIDDGAPPLDYNSPREVSLGNVSDYDGRTLSWKNLTLELRIGKQTRRLLDNLDGVVEPGKLTALMGVSGAGKTTLLNTLAGRLDFGTLTGDIYLDGTSLPKSFGRRMGYVQQQDVHLPSQTVREALKMAARLRRPQTVSMKEKDAYVEEVISMLEMEDISDALIGVPGAGLNLEQRKRVTIGVELSSKPDVLFLDEPSSGLDGQSALKIILLLRKLADSGQTILCTIHQPAAQIIEVFDHLLLLLQGGRVAYDGPLGYQCRTVLNYFEQSARACEVHENPAEYFLHVVGAGSRNNSHINWVHKWKTHSPKEHRNENASSLISQVGKNRSPLHMERTYAMPLHSQLSIVLHRAWLYYWRDPDYFVAKLMMNICNSLINGLTYLNSPQTEQGVYNRVFSAFMSLIVGPPLGLQAEARFRSLYDIFDLREKQSKTYHWIIFVLSAIIIELPYAFITSLVYWLLWYYPVGYFTNTSRAGYSFLMYELFSVFVHSLAQLCASVMPSLSATFMANGFFFMFFNTFAGTLSPEPVTPAGWRWFYKISPLFYMGEGMTVNVLNDLTISCEKSEAFVFTPPTGMSCITYAGSFLQNATGYLLNPESMSDCQYCRYKDGQSYYQQYGYKDDSRYRNIGIFIGFIALNYTAVICFTYLTKIRQWRRS